MEFASASGLADRTLPLAVGVGATQVLAFLPSAIYTYRYGKVRHPGSSPGILP